MQKTYIHMQQYAYMVLCGIQVGGEPPRPVRWRAGIVRGLVASCSCACRIHRRSGSTDGHQAGSDVRPLCFFVLDRCGTLSAWLSFARRQQAFYWRLCKFPCGLQCLSGSSLLSVLQHVLEVKQADATNHVVQTMITSRHKIFFGYYH